MYCEHCKYGSDGCVFQLTGQLIELVVGKEGRTADFPECRCPQCGTVGAHFRKAPWGNDRTRSLHPSRSQTNKKHDRRTNEEPFSDSPHKALKALDYSKNAPAM